MRIADRSQRHEEHAVLESLADLGCDLQAEAGLAGAARPGQGQQAVCLQELESFSQLPVTAHEAGELGGQIVGRVVERFQSRELGRQALDLQLKDLLRLGQILQPVLAQVEQSDPFRKTAFDQCLGLAGHDHLAAVSCRCDAGSAVYLEAHVVFADHRRLPRVQPHPHPDDRVCGQGCAWRARWPATHVRQLRSVAAAKAMKSASPSVLTSFPWWPSNSLRKIS